MKTGVIDIGNTAIKAGIFEGGELVDFVYAPAINELGNFFSTNGVDKLIAGSVAGIPDSLQAILKDFDVVFFDGSGSLGSSDSFGSFSGVKLPFDILCEQPQTVGTDRLALIAGAQALYPQENVLVVCLGTCVTYNMLRNDGIFIPGAISAGLSMQLRAMHRDTSALPLVELSKINFRNLAPVDTEESMLNGCVAGLWYEIQGYINQYSKTYENLKTILTGGDLKYYGECVSESLRIFAIPNLVLQGLNEILRYNKK